MSTLISTYNFVVWYEFGNVTIVFLSCALLCWVAIECSICLTVQYKVKGFGVPSRGLAGVKGLSSNTKQNNVCE